MMRKFILAGLAVAAFSAVRADEVESDVTLGALRVEAPQERVIVSVPWCACSTNENQAIAVSNIIKTAGLTVGDKVHLYSTSGACFQTWELAENGGIKYWASVKESSSNGTSDTPSSAETTANRGDALLLVRQNPVTDDVTNSFYICGQVSTNSVKTTIAKGSEETAAYTLLAPPVATNIALNAIGWDGDKIEDLDRINVVGKTGLYNILTWYPGFGWGYKSVSRKGGVRVVTTNTCTIVAGSGFWYVSKGGTQEIDWSTLK